MADNYMKKFEDKQDAIALRRMIDEYQELVDKYEELPYDDFENRLKFMDEILAKLSILKNEEQEYLDLFNAYTVERKDIVDAKKEIEEEEERLQEEKSTTDAETEFHMETEDDFGIPGERSFRENAYGKFIEEHNDDRDDDGDIE